MSTSRCVLHHVTTSVFSFQPVQANALKSLTQYEGRPEVVPRLGIRHVQVGRSREVTETVRDMTRISEGGSAVRFVIGEYGSGKTFFLTLARNVAAEKK